MIIRDSKSVRVQATESAAGEPLILKELKGPTPKREFAFYQAINAGRLPANPAKFWRVCQVADLHTHERSYSLHLENLQQTGYQHFTMRQPQFLHVVDAIAELNGWLDASQEEAYGLDFRTDIAATFMERFWQCVESPLLAQHLTKDDYQTLVSELAPLVKAADRLRRSWQELPFCFCHNDLNHGNIFVDAKERSFVFIDWQTFGFSPVGSDLTQFLMPSYWASHRPYYYQRDKLLRMEAAMLNRYHQGLQQNGQFRGRVSLAQVTFGYQLRAVSQTLLTLLPRYLRSVADGSTELVTDEQLHYKLQTMFGRIQFIQRYI